MLVLRKGLGVWRFLRLCCSILLESSCQGAHPSVTCGA